MRNRISIAILLTFFAFGAGSQELIQRASKTTEYRYEDFSSLHIQAEKATIRITGKPQQTVELKISLVAKHQDPKTARNDLKYIRFVSEKAGTKLILKNFYETANRKIESNMSVIYDLIVPEAMAIQLQNLYGSVNITDLSGSISASVSFGRIDMQSITGSTRLQMRYSSLSARKIAGKLTGTLSKSDAVLADCAAQTELEMQYGELRASLLSGCELLRVSGSRTEVQVQLPSAENNLDLKTSYSSVEVFGKAVGAAYRSTSKSSNTKIWVTTSYCPIKISLQ